MHATIHDLLNLRDGDSVDVEVERHVAACAACGAALLDLRRLRSCLAAAAGPEPSADGWDRIAAALDAGRLRPRRDRRGVRAAGLAAAAILILLVFRLADPPPSTVQAVAPTPEVDGRVELLPGRPAPPPADVSRLIARSQSLEFVLERLPRRPLAERAGTALMLDALESRIAGVDATLMFSADTGLSDLEIQQLWQERVLLLDSLINVRYAQAQQLAF